MQNFKRNPIKTSRLVYQKTEPTKGAEEQGTGETLDNVTKVIERSYGEQLGLMSEIDASLEGIRELEKKYMEVTKEMNQERVSQNKAPEPRLIESFGRKVEIRMDVLGEIIVLIEEPRGYLAWAKEQQMNQPKQNDTETPT